MQSSSRTDALESSADRASPRASAGLVLAALAGLLIARGVLVASLGDVFFYGEEQAKAAAGKAMLDGLGVPHHQLAYHDYEGGGFVFSHLDAAAFALLGPSLLAVKAVALGWSALTLLSGLLLTARCFGRVAAAWFGALFVLAPQSFQKLSLLALGIHFEACLFLALALLLLVRIVVGEKASPWGWAALGGVCGFGVYFSYVCVLMLAYVGLVLLVRRPGELLGRRGLSALAGLALGALPLVVMASLVGTDVLDIHGASLGSTAGDRWTRLVGFVGSLLAGRGVVEVVGLAAWSAAPLGVLVWLLTRWRTSRERTCAAILGGFLAVFALAYVTSDFLVGEVYHYFRLNRLSPVWLVSAVLTAGGLGLAFESPSTARRLIARGLGIFLLVCGVGDLVRSVGPGSPTGWADNLRRLAAMPGYGYDSYLPRLGEHLEGEPLERARVALRFDEPAPSWLRMEGGQALVAPVSQSVEQAVELARALEPEEWRSVLLGTGSLWARLHSLDCAARVRALESAPDAVRDVLAEASGRFGSGPRVTAGILLAELSEARAAGAPPAWLEGLGWRLSRVEVSPEDDVAIVPSRVEGQGRRPVPSEPRQGVGGRMLPGFLLAPAAAEAWLERIPGVAEREALRRGWQRALAERTLP